MKKHNEYIIIFPYTKDNIDIETFLFMEQKVLTYISHTQDEIYYKSLRQNNLIQYIENIINDFYGYYKMQHSLASLYKQAFCNDLYLDICIRKIIPIASSDNIKCTMECNKCWENTILLKDIL